MNQHPVCPARRSTDASSTFTYTNPNPPPSPARPPRYGPPPSEDLDDPDVFDRLRERHDGEIAARLRWCLDNGLAPAHDHVHLAPGDDANFMVRPCSSSLTHTLQLIHDPPAQHGVPPWHPDGSVNPPGVADRKRKDRVVDKRTLIPDYEARGWSCTRCAVWVDAPRREPVDKEPEGWWWCKKCKAKKPPVAPCGGIAAYFHT